MEDSRSRARSRTRSPPPRRWEERYRSRSPPPGRYSYSPERKFSRSPRRRYSRSPRRRYSRSPRRRISRSPRRRISPSPRRRYSRSPRRRHSRSPDRRNSPPPRRRASQSPTRSRPSSRSSPPRRWDDTNRPKRAAGGGSGGGGGFRWKQKARAEDGRNGNDREESGRLERGYRPEQERSRRPPRSPVRDGGRESHKATDNTRDEKSAGKEKKEKRERKSAPAMAPVGEEMIIVNVNDRLGTKASIPCLASDPISTSLRTAVSFFSFFMSSITLKSASTPSSRAIQSPGSCTDWARASRDHAEAARRAAFQGSIDLAGLWRQQRGAIGSVSLPYSSHLVLSLSHWDNTYVHFFYREVDTGD